jgi:hypothetical protein
MDTCQSPTLPKLRRTRAYAENVYCSVCGNGTRLGVVERIV